MDEVKISGQVTADIIELRFFTSGKISQIFKRRSDSIKKGELIASLDKKSFQAELDRELADYERTRAEFEIFVKKQGNASDDISKYQKVQMQSVLNSSVKSVELAKFRLDSCDLISPISGQIIDDGNNRPNQFISPASSAYKIVDADSLVFRVNLEADKLDILKSSANPYVQIRDQKFPVTFKTPYYSGVYYTLDAIFSSDTILPIGLSGAIIWGR